ncbi:hypothetical protein ACFVGY_36620 [Streptomyces sp. NPDC127106]|uniref:hypothetical protein n=1 Tax=Streptomyces sp. NPDC127106 TaxID=3345360 RepID=UPI00362B72A7
MSISVERGDGATGRETGAGGQTVTTAHQYGKPGGHTVQVTVTDQVTQASAVNQVAVWTRGSHYSPYGPKRLLDTRDGTGTAQGQIEGYGTVTTQVAGKGWVSLSPGATAVALNVTVTNPRSDGHLTAYPSGQQAPTASHLNFTTGRTPATARSGPGARRPAPVTSPCRQPTASPTPRATS